MLLGAMPARRVARSRTIGLGQRDGGNPEDRALAEKQKFCPVTDERLGTMGVPQKVMVEGTPVFVCCKSCNKELLAKPAVMLAKVEGFKKGLTPKK